MYYKLGFDSDFRLKDSKKIVKFPSTFVLILILKQTNKKLITMQLVPIFINT